MAAVLPRLRMDLDFMPSPVSDRPGLLIRDQFQYSDMVLIIPPPLVACLECFDGERDGGDLRAMLVELTGELQVGELQQHLQDTLSRAGFLEDEIYQEMREARHREFADAPERAAAHAGSAYPDEPEPLRATMNRYLDGVAEGNGRLTGIAAPHVSPEGGWRSYRAAYLAAQAGLSGSAEDKTFVVLGTSHYGAPSRFGLLHKSYSTPFGTTRTDGALIDELASKAPRAVIMDDYCHAFEHSIEFQIVFLQHLFGAQVRVLPILCGSFAESIHRGGMPERNEDVRAFLDALGEMQAREGDRLFWVLGVDMAHMGVRYGDADPAHADRGYMQAVSGRDQHRMERIAQGEADAFWSLVQENSDDLKWCGSAPFYTFLRAVPQARGRVLRYEQWNIDEQSVVSFAGMAFT